MAAWIDICASVSAMRFAQGSVVTASMDEIHFLLPVRAGMVVAVKSQVNQAWRSSMEVGVRVEAENPHTGERAHCCSAYLTFVAVDGAGRPRNIPELDAGDDSDVQRRAQDAQDRRDHRLAMREKRRGTP